MEVQWLGTATVLVRNGKDVLLIDPYNQPYNKLLERSQIRNSTTLKPSLSLIHTLITSQRLISSQSRLATFQST